MKKIVLFAAVLTCALPFLVQAQVINHLGGGTKLTVSTTRTKVEDKTFKGKGARFVSICLHPEAVTDILVNGAGVTADTGERVTPGKCWHSGSLLARSVSVYVLAEVGTADITVTEAGP